MKKYIAAIAVAAVTLAGCATNYSVTADASAGGNVTYNQGVATTESDLPLGAVKVTPLGPNTVGQLQFGVAALNKAGKPVNFGFENVSATFEDGKVLRLFDRAELERQWKSRAAWAQLAVAAAGGLSAAAANANAYSTTRGTFHSPYGTSHFVVRTYDPAVAYAGTAAATATTVAASATIESRLNSTLAQLNGELLQTTTIQPGDVYGGMVVADRLPRGGPAKKITVKVDLNGEIHTFKFNVAAS